MTQRVLLIPSHRAFWNTGLHEPYLNESAVEGITLTPQMLGWPVKEFGMDYKSYDLALLCSLRHCLEALLGLHPFTSAVSMRVDRKNKLFQTTVRDWCHIYLVGKSVAQFTHHRAGGKPEPFNHFCEWPGRSTLVEDWTTTVWRNFFLTSIRQYCEREKEAAQRNIEPLYAVIGFNKAVIEFLPSVK